MPRKTPEGSYRYRAIAASIREQIDAGHLRTGERLPSVRQLMRDHAASMATIVRALMMLEADACIRSAPRSGWFVTDRVAVQPATQWRTRSAPAASPVAVNQLVLQMLSAASDASIVSMGSTVVDRSLLPAKALNRALVSMARRRPELALGAGGSPLGDLELRTQIARLMAQREVLVRPDEIVITAGDGLSFEMILQLIAPKGSVVAVESPTYFGTLQALENLGLEVMEIATDAKRGIDLAALSEALESHDIRAVIVTPTCQNPFGFTMGEDAKAALLELAEKHDLAIVEDDIYGDLYQGDFRPSALKSRDRSDRVVYCSSFSRSLSPGWRIGWTIPGRWREQFLQQKIVRGNSTSTLPQAVLAHYLAQRGYMGHLDRLRKTFAAQMPTVRELIGRHFPSGTKVTEPRGGYIFWIELPADCDAVALSLQAIKVGISIAPGPIFSAGNRFSNCLRLSIGAPLSPRIEKAIGILGRSACDMAEGEGE